MIEAAILERYEGMIGDCFEARCEPEPGTNNSHLLWMLGEIRNQSDDFKSNRWLGFIQACLIVKGYTTVEAERNFTRPYFSKEHTQ